MESPGRIALTGATGNLGRQVLRQLLDAGHSDIHCLSRQQQPRSAGVTWFQGDLSDPYVLDDLVAGADAVIHAAALVSYRPLDVPRLLRVNAEGTAHIVNACLHAATTHLIHVSSTAAIGRPQHIPRIDEETEWVKSPYNTPYAESKYKAELEVFRGQEEGLNISIINPALFLDPTGHARSTRLFMDRIRRGDRHYPAGGNGFVDIRDVARCILEHLDRRPTGQRLILSAADLSYQELLAGLAKAAGKPTPNIALTGLAALWQTLLGRLTPGPSLFPVERMLASLQVSYDNSRSREIFGFTYTPLDATLAAVAGSQRTKPSE